MGNQICEFQHFLGNLTTKVICFLLYRVDIPKRKSNWVWAQAVLVIAFIVQHSTAFVVIIQSLDLKRIKVIKKQQIKKKEMANQFLKKKTLQKGLGPLFHIASVQFVKLPWTTFCWMQIIELKALGHFQFIPFHYLEGCE